MTTLLTVTLDSGAQAELDALRQRWYPPALNRIPAHLTLFHTLPHDRWVADALAETASQTAAFTIDLTEPRSMGRGAMLRAESPELLLLHGALRQHFEAVLTPQDRQGFRPHIVIQNKATPAEAQACLAALQHTWQPTTVPATGLTWHEYLGGPWRELQQFPFAPAKS